MTQQQKKKMQGILADAVRQAEYNIMALVKTGGATMSTDPYVALTGLAVHTAIVVEGGKAKNGGEVHLSTKQLLALLQFIATSDKYTPSIDFPFTKDQLRKAFYDVPREEESTML